MISVFNMPPVYPISLNDPRLIRTLIYISYHFSYFAVGELHDISEVSFLFVILYD